VFSATLAVAAEVKEIGGGEGVGVGVPPPLPPPHPAKEA
jgi:hypothetical protein